MPRTRKPKTKPLDQIEIFTKRGGKRAGSVVMRIPAECIDAVNAIIATHKSGNPITDLKPVTTIKSESQPAIATEGPWLDKYINPSNPNEFWSGRGRIPSWVYPHMTRQDRSIPDSLLNPNPQIPLKRRFAATQQEID